MQFGFVDKRAGGEMRKDKKYWVLWIGYISILFLVFGTMMVLKTLIIMGCLGLIYVTGKIIYIELHRKRYSFEDYCNEIKNKNICPKCKLPFSYWFQWFEVVNGVQRCFGEYCFPCHQKNGTLILKDKKQNK